MTVRLSQLFFCNLFIIVYIYNKSKGVRSEYGGFDDMGGA